jgi:hypothetical protein
MPTKKKNAAAIKAEDAAVAGLAYVAKKEQIKALENECKKLRPDLEGFVEANGQVQESGTQVAVLNHAGMDVTLKRVYRESQTLVPDAEDILRANGLEEAIETVTVVREDVIERLYDDNKISDDLLRSLYTSKSSYAFSAEAKKHYEVS